MTAWWGRKDSLLEQVRIELALLRLWVDEARPKPAPPLEVDAELHVPVPGQRQYDAEIHEIEEFLRGWIGYELSELLLDGAGVRPVVRPVGGQPGTRPRADVRLTRGGKPIPGQRPRIARWAGPPPSRAADARLVFRVGDRHVVEATYDLVDSGAWVPIGRDLPVGVGPRSIVLDRQLAMVPTGHWMSLRWLRHELRLRREADRLEYHIDVDGVVLPPGQERRAPVAGQLRFHRAGESSVHALEYRIETVG